MNDSMHGLLINRRPRLIFPQIACFDVSTRDVMQCHAPAALAAAVAVRNPSPAGELAAFAPPLPSRFTRAALAHTKDTAANLKTLQNIQNSNTC